MKRVLSAALWLLSAGMASAQTPSTPSAPTPLTAPELAQCAQQVQTLRTQSPALMTQVDDADVQRRALLAQRATADAAAARAALDAHLQHAQTRQQLNAQIGDFNQQVAALRARIQTLAQLRQAYAAQCAQRPYRRSDFERLADSAQAAMRAGLADITVPLLQAAQPLP